MSKQKLTIETTLKLDETVITDPPIERNIWVDCAFKTTVTVPKNAPGNKKCYRVEAGPEKLLKFLLLQPIVLKDDDKTPEAPADSLAILSKEGKEFKFHTSDAIASTGDINLADTQIYADDQLLLLFGKTIGGELQLELEKITFYNPTERCVSVTIIQGRNLTPCDEDDAECAPAAYAGKK